MKERNYEREYRMYLRLMVETEEVDMKRIRNYQDWLKEEKELEEKIEVLKTWNK